MKQFLFLYYQEQILRLDQNNQTESGENVANQERNGATAEKTTQVLPSPQYEGAVTYRDWETDRKSVV